MPNIKSAKKRVLTSAKKKVLNNDKRASMRTAIKTLEKTIHSGDAKKAQSDLLNAVKKIDKARSKGIVHENFASRQKARLMSKVNELIK